MAHWQPPSLEHRPRVRASTPLWLTVTKDEREITTEEWSCPTEGSKPVSLFRRAFAVRLFIPVSSRCFKPIKIMPCTFLPAGAGSKTCLEAWGPASGLLRTERICQVALLFGGDNCVLTSLSAMIYWPTGQEFKRVFVGGMEAAIIVMPFELEIR